MTDIEFYKTNDDNMLTGRNHVAMTSFMEVDIFHKKLYKSYLFIGGSRPGKSKYRGNIKCSSKTVAVYFNQLVPVVLNPLISRRYQCQSSTVRRKGGNKLLNRR
ncbi:hypothetical protein C0J52_17717 [Blattella germanica]|nr:hypothetical protein C0J52_17717 [Blattella germanica]